MHGNKQLHMKRIISGYKSTIHTSRKSEIALNIENGRHVDPTPTQREILGPKLDGKMTI